MIGQNIFYIDLKSKKILTGKCIGMHLSETGYVIYEIKNENDIVMREKAFVFLTEQAATKQLETALPIQEEMLSVQQKANATLDCLRVQILGTPEYPVEKGELK